MFVTSFLLTKGKEWKYRGGIRIAIGRAVPEDNASCVRSVRSLLGLRTAFGVAEQPNS